MVTVEEFINHFSPDLTVEEKNKYADYWITKHLEEKGKVPPSRDLVKLADWLLAGDLKDKSRSKVQNTEFPILSRSQIERRYRELSMESEIVDVLRLRKINNLPTKKRDTGTRKD